MKVLTVCGITGSGKTTVVTAIIAELKRRGYSVGSVKDIHFDGFAIDTEGTNTHQHRCAGAEPVTARGHRETDVLYGRNLEIEEVLCHYRQDYVVLEGVYEVNAPKILTAHTVAELEERFTERVFLVSGRISGELDSFRGLPVLSPFDGIGEMVDIIERVTPEYRFENAVKLLVDGQEQQLSLAVQRELAQILCGVKTGINGIEKNGCVKVELLLCEGGV